MNDNLDINIVCKTDEQIKGVPKNRRLLEMTPLQFAFYNDQNKIIKLLLSKNCCKFSEKININKRSIEAIIGNEIEIFERTLLYVSIEKRNISAIKLLLSRTDININNKSFHVLVNKNIRGITALHLAVIKNDLGIVKILLEKEGIDINIEDDQGKKPIDYTKNPDIKLLLSH